MVTSYLLRGKVRSLIGMRERSILEGSEEQHFIPALLKGQFQGQQTRGERRESCLARSPPSPPLAPAPFKICAHFWEGCRQ